MTGFTAVEYAIVGKWLGLLKEIAPAIERVALLGNPEVVFTKLLPRVRGHRSVICSEANCGRVCDSADIDHAVEALAREPNGGVWRAGIHRLDPP